VVVGDDGGGDGSAAARGVGWRRTPQQGDLARCAPQPLSQGSGPFLLPTPRALCLRELAASGGRAVCLGAPSCGRRRQRPTHSAAARAAAGGSAPARCSRSALSRFSGGRTAATEARPGRASCCACPRAPTTAWCFWRLGLTPACLGSPRLKTERSSPWARASGSPTQPWTGTFEALKLLLPLANTLSSNVTYQCLWQQF
jgi:hypothetical protein